MINNFDKFIVWEASTRDTIDFKKTYVDMADGDVMAGLMLSELVYWYLPSKGSSSDKLRVEHDGEYWIAVRRYEWWDRTRMSPKQSDRASKVLIDLGLIVKSVYKFNNEPVVHLRIQKEAFMVLWNHCTNNPPENPFLPKDKIGYSPKVKNDIPQKAISKLPKGEELVTEITSQTTNKEQQKKKKIKAQTDKSVDVGIHSYIKIWVDLRGGDTLGNPYVNMTYRGYVQHMIDNGVTVQDMQDYITGLRTQSFWQGKSIGLRYIAENICAWKASQPIAPSTPHVEDKQPESYEPLTPEMIAEFDRAFAELVEAKRGK